jgi:hypothetical protein
MDELEKLKAAKEVRVEWELSDPPISYHDWIDAEIARLEDPHAEGKRLIALKIGGIPVLKQEIIDYVRHIEGELAHYKIQYQHAKEAASEPLDPKRVLATAAKLISKRYSDDGGFLDLDRARAYGVCSGLSENAKPYEVQNDQV